MPSAGAIAPPCIVPLRAPVPGVPTTHIDCSTYIEIETESPRCKIYFTTSGAKPNPFQLKVAGREQTFRYKAPFTLKTGKRTLKAIAVTRDGLQESAVVTKTFTVDDTSGFNNYTADDDESLASVRSVDTYVSEYNPKFSKNKPRSTKKPTRNSRKEPPRSKSVDFKQAWSESNGVNNGSDHVNIPDGPFNPTNYSGTQVNVWGVPPHNMAGWLTAPGGPGGVSYPTHEQQLGYMTEKMLQSLDEQKQQTMNDMRTAMQQEIPPPAIEPPPPPEPVIEYVKKEPELRPISRGNGDWKEQLEHIYAHLIEHTKNHPNFKKNISSPKFGQISGVVYKEEEDCFNLNITLAKPGVRPKPKLKTTVKALDTAKKLSKAGSKKAGSDTEATKKKKEKVVDPYFETEEYEQEGTVKAWPDFNAEGDAEIIRNAMKGFGTDEATIINVLAYRSNSQRLEIAKVFKTMFGKDLTKELNGELSGNFCDIMVGLLLHPANYDANEIRKAVEGLGTDDDVLVEILCTRTNKQIQAIKAAYKNLFQKSLEKDVKDDTSGHFKRLLVSQIQANRDESPTFDRNQAKADAQALFEAGENKWGTDESKFNQILSSRSFAHLRAVFEEYGTLSKKSMEDVIKAEFSGDIKNGLLTIVRVIQNKPGYFAKQLHKSMQGLGTNDDLLVRVVVTRCECDMVQIKEEFQKQYKGTLAEWIIDDTSGDYKETLLALIGERACKPPAKAADPYDVVVGEPEPEMEQDLYEEEGVVGPIENFQAEKDCEVLRKAMKGFGTDEKAIIGVIPARSNDQRQQLLTQYKTMYGKDLIKELKGELGGSLKDTVVGLMKTSTDFSASELHKAMKGLGTDEDVLIEQICTKSNAELAAVKAAYRRLFSADLEKDIVSETSGHFKRLLVSCLQANRNENREFDRAKARADAEVLYKAGEKKWGTDESRFNVILCSRSYGHLRAMFEEYKKFSKKDIEDAIKSEMSGDLEKGMLTTIRVVRNKAAYFAKLLHDSMKGLGTDDDTLIRVMVSRCEVDMVQVKQEFLRLYKQSLDAFVADDLSGDYKKIIVALVNGNGCGVKSSSGQTENVFKPDDAASGDEED
ncbi:unnamed protein product [Owenia fusiformis]|uniref:Annexin n=1 Tax=Owenia fusiformis TaxID=6347 RepID=A0A8J1TQV7_OWEFU|nr:unnamed protein product [Owenia fusiformis]